MGRTAAHHVIAARRVRIDDVISTDAHREVDRFMRIALDDAIIHDAARALYLMLHKPVGVISATHDLQHPTVLDLIGDADKGTLHIAGRLDRSTSGLVLLTNDGRWSKRLMHPDKKVAKVYLVETVDPISADAVDAFADGFHFHTEDVVTRPAELVILDERRARLTLHEGRYHQIKRMFHRVHNRVVRLHRERIGSIALPSDLTPGMWRPLTKDEISSV